VKGFDVVILEVDSMNVFQLLLALLGLDAIEHIARKIEVLYGAHAGRSDRMSRAPREQPFIAAAATARLTHGCCRSAERQQPAVQLIGPAVDGANEFDVEPRPVSMMACR